MRVRKTLLFVLMLAIVSACDRPDDGAGHTAKTDDPTNILKISATGMRFAGDDTISSGWTTIRLNNQDSMLHFAMLVRLPDGVTATQYSDDLGSTFQRGYDLMLEGKDEEVAAAFGSIPAWVSELTYHGGPGFISGNRSADSTQYLEPGNYVLECYIKSNGIFHSYSPEPGKLTMILPLKVTDTPGNMAEPEANATLTINATGIQLTEGDLKTGLNSIRVKFDTQIRFPSFVGQDVHIMRINTDADIQSGLDWMDWQKPEGLLVPSPVTFIGGINDVMPAGSTAYFSADLSPGRYAFISEAPKADQKGLLMEFEISLDK
ncbi:MAG: hypothetical protein GQ538_03190 [Xanthomonadales bacterium]|nr:hypothetical protein [Xanthomonadales bacterium]